MAMELVKQAAWAETSVRIHHLRTAGGREVDILIESGDGSVCGIEVKLGATAHSRDFAALRHLQSKLGSRFKLGVVVHTGPETLPFGQGLWALPVSALWTPADTLTTDHRSTTGAVSRAVPRMRWPSWAARSDDR
jgi:uncharacterized protein